MSGFKSLDAGSAFAFISQAHDTVTSHLNFGPTALGSDIVFGGAGNDTIIGYGRGGPSPAADSSYASQDKADYLDGGAGNDYILGAGGNDVVIGGAGNDRLLGGDGNDLIYGGTGNDVISSGPGDDLLWGGAGRDVFSYARDPTSGGIGQDARYGVDTILDFKPGTDKLEFLGFSPIEGSVKFIDNGHALEVHFDYQYIQGVTHAEVDLVGVHSLGSGDLVFG